MRWTKELKKEMEEEWGLKFCQLFGKSQYNFYLKGALGGAVIFPASESASIENWIEEAIKYNKNLFPTDYEVLKKHYDKYKIIHEQKKLLEQSITTQSTTKKEKFKL